MACGLPVVVTAGGSTEDFVPLGAGWRIPSQLTHFAADRIGEFETAGTPWCLEPDGAELAAILQAVVADSRGRAERGAVGSQAALKWTWARTAAVIEERVRQLRTREPLRFSRPYARSESPGWARLLKGTGENGGAFVRVVGNEPELWTDSPRPRVSLCMIVRNEEHNLRDCITPVRDLVHEVIVVDTGSTDHTREIALELGARVFEFPWVDSFSAARNESIRHATGDWVFWLDADDRVDADNRTRLAQLFTQLRPENAAFVMKCSCTSADPGGSTTIVDHVRLFRNDPRIRWTYRVHEQILPALRRSEADVRWAGVTIRHVGYRDPALRRRKLDRDLRLLILEREEQPHDPFTLFNLGSVLVELGDIRAALVELEQSLSLSDPLDSIVRKLYALIVECRRQLGEAAAALDTCRAGRGHYPDDAELLFLEGNLLREFKDYAGAEQAFRRLIAGNEGHHFASVDDSLRGYKARHCLAVVYFEQGRMADAEREWHAVMNDAPHFPGARQGLNQIASLRHRSIEREPTRQNV
jgi:tetratricopeptide (TPR) repeat protein